MSAFGKTSLGLTYSLVFAEALLSPAIPSVAARAGGIFFPLAKVSPQPARHQSLTHSAITHLHRAGIPAVNCRPEDLASCTEWIT